MHFDTYFNPEFPVGHRLLSTVMHRSMTASPVSYREIMRFSRLVTGLTCAFMLQAHAASVEEYTQYLPDGANLALMAQKVGSSTPLVDYHSKQMALPASTMKVVTALAALLELGPDFRFRTTLETEGKIDNGTLKGDLIARFGGDPTLSRQDLRNMVAALTKQGITHIQGNLVVDTSVFSSHDKAPGWPWNDNTQCFSAPPAAAIVDKNCFSVSLYSAERPNDNAFIRVASYYPVTMFSQVRTLAKGSPDAPYCELDVVPGELNRYTLTGCMTQRSEPLPLAFAIQDGAAWAGAILKAMLQDAGIDYSGHLVRQTRVTEPGTLLAETQSAPLHDLLKIMLKKSDNMIADTVFRTIGRHYFNVPGTWRAGSDAVRRLLRQKANIDLGNSIQVDGSGLSRHDLIAPATMMQVLQYIAQNDQQLNFISMLPLAGYDGTLRYRGGLHEAGVDGKVSAKTGSLSGVYNLAGFITTASGQRVAFVQFLSGYAVPPEDKRIRRVPLVRFESRLYKDIYQNN
ncbi:D-alanyl-D-alanine carboxypeptidase DacB [Mixta intestinalis]|uniref:D-alanyl-D-alanine carboxypeptidase DacB n=2 Tax=Mixta intestinalis TaxID=1615494 RepID=A0A6P1Q6V2_9GAMM|nr:D-alanyl-D-alanine carboxypeptidase DacB [Mixta intestinalis]